MPQDVVIVGTDGREHVFPPGFDPKRAAGIVREKAAPRSMAQTAGDVATGVAKGVGNTVAGLGELVHQVPGVSRAVDTLYGQPGVSQASFQEARRVTQPTNTAQKVGYYGSQIGQFLLPTGAVSRGAKLASEIGKSGVLTAAQGGSAGETAVSAGLSAVVPGAGAVKRAGKSIANAAEPLVKAALKPTLASLKRITGKGNLDAKASALVRFIIDNKLTTADKARALFQETEHALQRVLSVKNAPTDEPTRVLRYLDALERSAARQRLPASDVAAIRNAAAELVEGSLGRDVVQMVPTPHATLVDQFGKPITVLVPKTTRVMRATTQAAEALDAARASGRWATRKTWGEIKGTDKEISKTVERAGRDAVKTAVPEARPLLATEGKALQSEDVLTRMAQRTGNRDTVSLPAQLIAGGELATGRVPVIAFAANWLRNNQIKAGMWADSLGKAIERGNAPLVADILKKLGVGTTSQSMRSAPATP